MTLSSTPIRTRCVSCGWLKFGLNQPGDCINPECAEGVPQPSAPEPVLKRNPRAVVYYLRWGDRIKIGGTMNLRQRKKAIYHDEIVAVEPGTLHEERMRQKQFAANLVVGQREWFHLTPQLAMHMSELRTLHGNPRNYE